MGVRKEAEYTVKSFDFHPGDYFLSYTDGLIENTDSKGRFMKQRTLKKTITDSHNIATAFDRIKNLGANYWQEGGLEDDITFLILARTLENHNKEAS